MVVSLNSESKKTMDFPVFDKKAPNTRLSFRCIGMESRSLLFVNDCFKNENIAVVGVFLQRLNKTLKRKTIS